MEEMRFDPSQEIEFKDYQLGFRGLNELEKKILENHNTIETMINEKNVMGLLKFEK